ncbi:MAG: Holliday junction resolvase RuvX [Acidimicrobiia bacterium]|nr:Holliday junction resolvase RuvX [Acidimicrobiia bacterium]
MGRLLGLDYGTKRIGIAISDTSQLIATPYEVVPADSVLSVLDAIVVDEGITAIVVGLPTSLSGEEGPSAEAARELAERVAAHTGLEVVLVDERFTSKVAEKAMIKSGMRRDKRRDIRDKMAATVMLQGHLDSLR